MFLLNNPVSIVFTNALWTLKSSHSLELVSETPCIPRSFCFYLSISMVTGFSINSTKSFFVKHKVIGTPGRFWKISDRHLSMLLSESWLLAATQIMKISAPTY